MPTVSKVFEHTLNTWVWLFCNNTMAWAQKSWINNYCFRRDISDLTDLPGSGYLKLRAVEVSNETNTTITRDIKPICTLRLPGPIKLSTDQRTSFWYITAGVHIWEKKPFHIIIRFKTSKIFKIWINSLIIWNFLQLIELWFNYMKIRCLWW